MSKLAKKLKGKILKLEKRERPLWEGPEVGGVTQSMLSRFIVCRERFRLLVVEGLKPVDRFNHRIEYGNMWHLCEEHYNDGQWFRLLENYCKDLCSKYRTEQEQVQKWYNVCKVQFPIYVKHWEGYDKRIKRTRVTAEEVFSVPYKLPSNETMLLRGKWDGSSTVGAGKKKHLYLDEDKTKGDINEQQMLKQLQFDMQTMFYLVAMNQEDVMAGPRGVLYNVVRRPLSGGVGSIRPHKPTKSNPSGESDSQFYARLGGIIQDNADHYFMRWKVEVSLGDVSKFCREFLDPVLEQLREWWEWVSSPEGLKNPFANPVHWRTPYGFYNVLAEGGSTEMDEFLATGSELGLTRDAELFTELM